MATDVVYPDAGKSGDSSSLDPSDSAATRGDLGALPVDDTARELVPCQGEIARCCRVGAGPGSDVGRGLFTVKASVLLAKIKGWISA